MPQGDNFWLHSAEAQAGKLGLAGQAGGLAGWHIQGAGFLF